MDEYASKIERAAGAGFSGSTAREMANFARGMEDDELTIDEIFEQMTRYPKDSDNDALREALGYAITHLAQKHVNHITHMLQP
jgi:hypothetical protein